MPKQSFYEQVSQQTWDLKSPQRIKDYRSDSLNSDSSIGRNSRCGEHGWSKSPESETSWTEEICLNALAYLDSGSDSENGKPAHSFNDSIKQEGRP